MEKDTIKALVLEREKLDSTGLENGVAIPHCRLPGIKKPTIILGINKNGIDFHSMDQTLSKAVFMIITPEDDPQSQLEIIAYIARNFNSKAVTENFVNCKTASELIAFLKSKSPIENHGESKAAAELNYT